MSHYLDTSLVAAAITHESGSRAIQSWLERQPLGALFISDWVVAEFSSALSTRLRTGQLTPELRVGAHEWFGRLTESMFEVLPVRRMDFRLAARLSERQDLTLRAGDALHLAVSQTMGFALCTLDKRLANAARTLGIIVQAIPEL